jgi:4-amino-4-deoxychorismate lyase
LSEWFQNGQRVNSVPAGDRGMQYGDGLFETVAIRGSHPRLWSLHVERMRASAERLGLPVPSEARLESALSSALAATTLDPNALTAKLLLTAGLGLRGYRRHEPAKTALYVSLHLPRQLDREAYATGVATRVCATRLAIQPALAGIKSLNRLEQVLASQELAANECFEGLMLDTEDNLICGTMSNVFVVRDNQYVTPRLDGAGVAGVMRRHIIGLLETDRSRWEETRLSLKDIESAEEVFLSNSQFGVVPVARIDERDLEPGTATRRVQALLASNGVPECEP